MGSYEKHFFWWWWRGAGNRLIASEKLIKVYLHRKQEKREKKHAPLQGSVRGYIREISVPMFLQIQTDIF